MDEEELEVKFYLNEPVILEEKVKALGAALVQPRIFELNLRYDTKDGELARTGQVLRLRKDVQAVLTYKGPGRLRQDVSVRQEIEFTTSDFVAASHFLEALGYQVAIIYEKYRTTYQIGPTEIVLDEMPFGNFAEIEGPDPASIRALAIKLGLNWEARRTESYLALFKKLQETRQLAFHNLTFSNFSGLKVSTDELGIRSAD